MSGKALLNEVVTTGGPVWVGRHRRPEVALVAASAAQSGTIPGPVLGVLVDCAAAEMGYQAALAVADGDRLVFDADAGVLLRWLWSSGHADRCGDWFHGVRQMLADTLGEQSPPAATVVAAVDEALASGDNGETRDLVRYLTRLGQG